MERTTRRGEGGKRPGKAGPFTASPRAMEQEG
jgi:hypothetical protein